MKFAKIFIILAVSMAAVAVAQDSSACGAYKVSPLIPTSDGGTEYRLYCGMFQFGSFIFTVKPNRTLVFRPHPDQHDANGWGTSWFMAPFLAGADPTSGSVNSITAGPGGIQANLSGLVANAGGNTYGNWNINGTLTYNSLAQKVTASGNLNIGLSGTLTAASRDLNLERLSSNYLYNVPRKLDGVGDTGDIKEVIVTYGIQDPHNFVWIPTPSEPKTYPTDTSTLLEIGLVGQINDVDTLAQGKDFIPIARKPTVNLAFSSTVAASLLSAGLAWDSSAGQDPNADNIGVNHLVLKGNSTATQMTFNFSMNSVTPGKDSIVIDFGDPYGIWLYPSDQSWVKLHSLIAIQSVAAYLDSNSQSDLVVNFGNPYGTWVLMRAWTNQSWVKLHDLSPISITAANLDSNGQDDLVINFGNPYGIWVWMNNQTWVKLHDLSPVSITAADLDGNAQSDLVVNFGNPYGTWVWMNNQTWVKLHDLSPVSITAADLDGNGQSDLVVNFGDPYGTWVWMNNQTWVKLHDLSPVSITAADLDGNGQDEVVIDFNPYGLWVWMNNQSWWQLHSSSPASVTAAYLDDNAQQDLVIDFAPYGIWQWMNNQTWVQLHYLPAKHIIALPQ